MVIESLLAERATSTPVSNQPAAAVGTAADEPKTVAEKKKNKSLSSYFTKQRAPGPVSVSDREAIEIELQSYLETPEVASETTHLSGQRLHEASFCRAAKLAEKYLCIPATSAFIIGSNSVSCHKPDR